MIHERRPLSNSKGRGAVPRGVYLDVFIQVDRLVVDVVPHEEVVDAGQQRHLRQGEDVHELLQGVAVRALWGKGTGGSAHSSD